MVKDGWFSQFHIFRISQIVCFRKQSKRNKDFTNRRKLRKEGKITDEKRIPIMKSTHRDYKVMCSVTLLKFTVQRLNTIIAMDKWQVFQIYTKSNNIM